jgi:hypothetical protein
VKKYFNFIWQERFAYIFAYVPKVACTNWKCVLRHQIGASDYLNPRLAHDREQSGLTFLSEEPRAHELLADPLLAKYAIVREPFSRALSAYLDNTRADLLQAIGGLPSRKHHAAALAIETLNSALNRIL